MSDKEFDLTEIAKSRISVRSRFTEIARQNKLNIKNQKFSNRDWRCWE
jgi:hypothetical protein